MEERKDPHLRAFIVWEPVLPTDWGSPSTWTLFRVRDTRAVQFWDRGWLLSKALGGPEHFNSADSTNKIGFEMGDVIWDFVAVYPPGSGHPSFSGAPVVAVIDDVRRELRQAEGLITSPPR